MTHTVAPTATNRKEVGICNSIANITALRPHLLPRNIISAPAINAPNIVYECGVPVCLAVKRIIKYVPNNTRKTATKEIYHGRDGRFMLLLVILL
jgi:hypothetical protein